MPGHSSYLYTSFPFTYCHNELASHSFIRRNADPPTVILILCLFKSIHILTTLSFFVKDLPTYSQPIVNWYQDQSSGAKRKRWRRRRRKFFSSIVYVYGNVCPPMWLMTALALTNVLYNEQMSWANQYLNFGKCTFTIQPFSNFDRLYVILYVIVFLPIKIWIPYKSFYSSGSLDV